MEQERIREHQIVAARIVMQEDLRGRSVERIHTLHVMADPDYSKLNRTRRESLRPVWGSLDTVIYYDILDVIGESMKTSSEIRRTFIELYRSVYPKVNKVIEKVREARNIDEFYRTINGPEDGMCKYAIFCMGDMEEFDNCPLWLEPIEKKSKTRDIYFETRDSYSQATFDNTEESMLFSPAFNTYVNRNKQKIAEYLGCDVSKLSQEITRMFIEGFKEEETGDTNGTPEMTARVERKLIMAYHQGSNGLFVAMNRKNPSWFKSYYYQPDVNHIIEDYYIARAMTVYYGSEMGEFNKLSLTRGSITEVPERDLKDILTLCNMDVIYKMFDILMDSYYENFTWDKRDVQKSRDIIAHKLKEMDNQIESYRDLVDRKNLEISSLKISGNTSKDEAIREYEAENKRLRDQIEKLEKENQQQKELIESQTELIESIQHTEEDNTDIIDTSMLQSHRFLFAGYFDTYLTELKTLFPNSVFMTNATKDISGIKVDYIVIATKYISHSMYYKVKSSPLYSENPCLMCNSSSVRGVLSDMNRFIKEQ